MAADFYVTADGGSESEVAPVAKAIEAEGFTVETGETGPNAEHLRNDGIVKPPTKLVFICNGGLAGQTYGSFALGYSDGMAFTIFAFDNYVTKFSTTTEDALKTQPLVSEQDSGDFATDEIAADFNGHTCCSYQQKHSEKFAFVTDETSAENLGKKIAHGQYTCGAGDGALPTNSNSSSGSAQIKDKTFEHCIKRICAATDSVFLVENNAAVLFPYTDWMAFTLRQQINQIRAKDMDPDLFEIDYNTEGFYNKVTTVWGADEEDQEKIDSNTENEEEKKTIGNTTTIQKTMPTGGTQLSEQYDPLVNIYGELEKKVTTNFPNEETAHFVMNALLIQYIRDFNNSCRVRAINNQKFVGGTFYAVENPYTKQSEMFYLNSYTIFKKKDQPITTDLEFKYGPEGAEELLDYQAYGGGTASGGQTNSVSSSATEEEIWKGTQKACHQWTCEELRVSESDTQDPQVAEDYYNQNVKAGKKFCLTCYGMSAWLYYQFNNKANIPCRVIGNSEHHVVELYKNNAWYKPTDEYIKYCEQGYRYNDYLRSASPVVLDAPNSPAGNNTNANPSGNTADQ